MICAKSRGQGQLSDRDQERPIASRTERHARENAQTLHTLSQKEGLLMRKAIPTFGWRCLNGLNRIEADV